MPENPLFEKFNECSYLYLREISEPRDHSLRLVVEEAKAGGGRKATRFGYAKPMGLSTIQPTSGSRSFEVLFNSVIEYLVTNVSDAAAHPGDNYEGTLLRIYSNSQFLDSVRGRMKADAENPGAFQHYAVICLDRIVDVVSTQPPVLADLLPKT